MSRLGFWVWFNMKMNLWRVDLAKPERSPETIIVRITPSYAVLCITIITIITIIHLFLMYVIIFYRI